MHRQKYPSSIGSTAYCNILLKKKACIEKFEVEMVILDVFHLKACD